MCGIAGMYLRDPEAKANLDTVLDTMLDEIEHRGGDATGFVALGSEGVTEWQKAACSAEEFTRYRRPVPKGTRTILAHTRWATQGLPAFVENNHPLRRGSFFVIHNGHVNNDNKLFELAGRKPYGQVDSEAIVARLASLGSLGKVAKVMTEIDGAAAIAAVDESKPGDLVLARGYASPLYVLSTKRYVLWGSTHSTVKTAYEKHIGRLPKKAKIEALAQGTVLHFVDGKLRRTKFAVYSPPPKVTYTFPKYQYTTAKYDFEKATPKEYATTVVKDDDEDDLTICDGCGVMYAWDHLDFTEVDDSGYTLGYCSGCIEVLDREYNDKLLGISEELATVNAAILEEDDGA